MEIDDSIVQLGAKLDAWWDGVLPMLNSEDRAAQWKALLPGYEMAKEFDHLKADGLAALTALLNHQHVADEERAASLIQGFAFSAKLASTLHDEFRDIDGETDVAHLRDAVVNALDALGSGRTALAMLLDHPDARVRASAGAYLIKSMPERVIPILREIEEQERANSAHFTAYWTLLRWQREGKHTETKS